MKRPVANFKGEVFFQDHLQLFVNRASEDFASNLHDHDFFEFAYIAEGGGFHHIGDEVHKVTKGQLCYIPIGVSHVFRPVSADLAKHPLIVYNCVFPPRLLAQLCAFVRDDAIRDFIEGLLDGSRSYFSISDREDSIEKLFLSLRREFALPRDGFADYLYSLLLQLLIVVHRIKQGLEAEPKSKLNRFDQLLSYMDQHFAEELTLVHLAQISGWSERHLQRLFIRHTEQPFIRYLQTLRIQKSRELLRSTQLKISVIAEMTGYKDIGSFLSVFKRTVGLTPTQYRKSVN